MDEKMRVVIVEPGQPARAEDINGSLEGLQEQVGGYIECSYPFVDQAGLISNDEGKLMGLEPNRALRTEDGDIYDIIAGRFLIVGLSEDNFASLTPEQEKTYLQLFKIPERFTVKNGRIEAVPIVERPDFETFRKDIIDDLKQRFSRDGVDLTITPQRVDKPSGSYDGISVSVPDTSVAMSLNLEPMYDSLQNRSFEDVANSMYESLRMGLDNIPVDLDANKVMDYSWVRNHLAIEVISKEQTGDFYKSVPYKEVVGDLVAIYRIHIDDNASAIITNSMFSAYGVSPEQLHADALNSSEKNFPINIRPMSTVLGEAFGQDVPDDGMGLYVCTSDNRVKGGAGIIAYDNFTTKASEKIRGDFFIMPSSIHEVLLFPDSGVISKTTLEDMVRTVNRTELVDEDILSDNVYHYDSKMHKLELASEFEARQKSNIIEFATAAPRRKGR